MKFKLYNRLLVYNNLEKLECYIHDMKLARQYQKYNNWHSAIIDRTGSMKHFLNVSPDTNVPLYISNYNKTFQDICIERTKELLSTNKKIYIFWSGGLDSTTILSSFYSLCDNKYQINICMTHDSLYESGSLYDDIIKYKFDNILLVQPSLDKLLNIIEKDSIILFGAHGGYICGLLPEHITNDMLNIPIQDYLNEEHYEFYSPFIEKFPTKIYSIKDFYYCYFFNFNWNFNSYLFYTNRNVSSNWVSFYNTLDFQNLFISGNERDHNKQCMRNFIYKFLGYKSKDYVTYKKTRPSYTNQFGNWLFIKDNNKIINLEDLND